MAEHPCVMCEERGVRRLGIAVPALVIPIRNYPVPYYMQFNGAICRQHTVAFTLKTFTDRFGPEWYELAGDTLRSLCKPATNPFPKTLRLRSSLVPPDNYKDVTRINATPAGFKDYERQFDFDWEAFDLMPNWEPVPKEECRVMFWAPDCLEAKGAHQTLGRLVQ